MKVRRRGDDEQEICQVSSSHDQDFPVRGLWLGALVSEQFLQQEHAASAAGVLWQSGLLEALVDLQVAMSVHGGTPHSAWPRGRVFARQHQPSLCGGKLRPQMLGYLNLPVLKLFSQHLRLRRVLAEYVRQVDRPSVVFSYNAGMPEALTARWFASEYGTPWVSVLADYPETSDPRIAAARRLALQVYGGFQKRWVAQASGRVFLSWALFQDEKRTPKYYLEGGIAKIRATSKPDQDQRSRTILFAGSLSAFTGIDLLLEAFELVKEPSCQLWICGRGNLEPLVVEAARRDDRIRFFGMLDQEQLAHRMRMADVFVNPRPSALPENRSNFPSKLLEYLSWCRPVVSTITPGIPPYYRAVVNAVDDQHAEGLANALREELDRSNFEVAEVSERIRAFVEGNLLWAVQARKFLDWLNSERLLRRDE